MTKIILGVIGGFLAWPIIWFSIEKTLSAIWPDWYGSDKKAFEEVLKAGGEFTPNSMVLVLDVVFGSLAAVVAGAVAAWIAAENTRSPLIVGCLLLAIGVAKLVMSWKYVPLWYHIVFTGALLPMTLLGGKLLRSIG